MGGTWPGSGRGPGGRVIAGLAALALVVALAACGDDDDGESGSSSEDGESAAAQSGQFCEGMDISFFPGGTEGGGFETVVYNGARAAEEAFGPNVSYTWSDWDPSNMVTQFEEAVATDPDGIAVMGHPGDDAFGPLIDDAIEQGILVTAMNTELPETQEAHATEGFGYVGARLHQAGFDLATEAIERGDLQAGDRAFVWGLVSQPGRGERTQGILDALEEAELTVDYLEIDDATNADPANGVSAFTGYVSSNPDVRAIFIDHGNLTSTIPTYMEAANLGADDIYAAGFDLSPATVQGVQDGFVDLVIDQQQWLQGFEAILQLCLTHSYGFSGLFIDTGGGFVDESNIDVIAPLVEDQIR
jgi:simple sugar transport system substrate-binding protein